MTSQLSSLYGIEASTIEEARNNWCMYAQRILENYAKEDITSKNVENTIYTFKGNFLRSKPKVEDGKIYISTYFPLADEVKTNYEQVWCKINTAARLDNSSIGIQSQGESRASSEMNKLALRFALNFVSDRTRNAYQAADMTIDYQDIKHLTGFTWSNSEVIFEKNTEHSYTLKTPYLRTDREFLDSLSYKYYFKVLSPKGAVDFIYKSNQLWL
ncbi:MULTISPECIES: hypothetical protein [unclassified Coleofasciculus]|uniref:hypothetical protein n=1 Tax=unclassified Coleofasciculus TaxID=2692782 RepID=UPI001881CCA7|nr:MULTISPECIES: hypothetical protein [unclassified Coleofasciculus]MBE9129301.1 hypothetical protein [Coleofasciculus sp. LEGE 07081]MBE9151947.1 hypothetical protein [Coleofasciculus sp. LEGE 07092]